MCNIIYSESSLERSPLQTILTILQSLGFLDLYQLSLHSPNRRKQIFSLTPAGQPMIWNTVFHECVGLIRTLTARLSDSKNNLLTSPNQLGQAESISSSTTAYSMGHTGQLISWDTRVSSFHGTHGSAHFMGHTGQLISWNTRVSSFHGTHGSAHFMGHTGQLISWDTRVSSFHGTHGSSHFMGHTGQLISC